MSVMAFALALAMESAALVPESPPEMPEWMAGCWIEQDGERWTEECWMGPRGGTMLGASRGGTGERVSETESMRIDANVPTGDGSVARIAFSAVQRSGGWTTFAWQPAPKAGPANGIAFVNATHDYPQKIRYWREGSRLLAEISQLDGSRARRWTYVQARQ
jgi:hypothetical protein